MTLLSPRSDASSSENEADILLLTALPEELYWIQKVSGFAFAPCLCQGSSYRVADVVRADRSVRIVTLRQLDKGPTIAAITATKAIGIWRPRFVVMTGFCAGVRGAVELGDLIVATQFFEHSSGQLRDGQLIPLENRVSLQPWFLDFLIACTEFSPLLEQIRSGYGQPLPTLTTPSLHYGSMACGPQVIKDQSYIASLKARDQALLGLDMESYGVALAAAMCSTHARGIVPLVVKGVCDFADAEKSDRWHDYCAYASAAFVLALLEQVFVRDHAYRRLKGFADALD